jgi:hypothetical protein
MAGNSVNEFGFMHGFLKRWDVKKLAGEIGGVKDQSGKSNSGKRWNCSIDDPSFNAFLQVSHRTTDLVITLAPDRNYHPQATLV